MCNLIDVKEIGWGICIDAKGGVYVGIQINNESFLEDEEGKLHEIARRDDYDNVTAIKTEIYEY